MKRILLISLSVFIISEINSQALYEVPLEEKIANSSLIIEGKVISQQSFWNPSHTMIYTSSKVEIYKVFKGSVNDNIINVLTQGGTVDDINIQASELLELYKNDVGLFFCYPSQLKMKAPNSQQILWDVYSSAQGCFKYYLLDGSAAAPFVRYENIQTQLYSELTNKIGKLPVIINTSFVPKLTKDTQQGAFPINITSFSPDTVKAGSYAEADNILTINGTGFGSSTSSPAGIYFDNPDDGSGGTPYFLPADHDLVISWTDTKIVLRVPAKTGAGKFSVMDAAGKSVTSSSPLEVKYAIIDAAGFMVAPKNRSYNLMNMNGHGGYDYLYSTSTTGGGTDFSMAIQKISFERAVNTWKEVAGLNFYYKGTTSSQTVNPIDGINIIMMDHAGVVLPAGVLAVAYSAAYSCVGEPYARRQGFDIVIRNSGVSKGSVNLNNGPCRTSISLASLEFDLESVLLHELGHTLNLGHINDNYIGTFPNIDPGKLMNSGITNGTDRHSPDWSSLSGAQYCINQRGLFYGDCTSETEMHPLPTIAESKDECPGVFPITATAPGTTIFFDLTHATSNKNHDPQYNYVDTTGTGTGITNNAYYAIRTGFTAPLGITVSDYTPYPSNLHTICSTDMGIELSIYDVSSCPTGQAFPKPIIYRTFSGNGALPKIGPLPGNHNYLIMVDGINSTKATFRLTFKTTVPIFNNSETVVSKTSTTTQLENSSAVVINNPVHDFLDLKWNFPIEQGNIFTLKLMSNDGKLLKSNKLSSASGTAHIDISQYSSGLYFIIITNEQQQIINRSKVVKQ